MLNHIRAGRGTRILIPALALAFALGTGAAAQAAAAPHPSAAPGAGSVTFTIPAGVTAASVNVGGVHALVRKTAAEKPETVNCSVDPEAPFRYYGGTYGGGEEGIASVDCTQVVYEIETVAALFLNGTAASDEVSYGVNTVYEESSSSADAIYPLEAGDYYTAGQVTITNVYGGGSTTSPAYFSLETYLA
jgi:hypothetical protein